MWSSRLLIDAPGARAGGSIQGGAMDELLGYILLYAGLPIAGIAWLVTLGMRIRLRRAIARLDAVTAARDGDAQAIAALQERVAQVEHALARQPAAAPAAPVPAIPAAEPLVETPILAQPARVAMPVAEPPAGTAPARVAALFLPADTVSESISVPSVPPQEMSRAAEIAGQRGEQDRLEPVLTTAVALHEAGEALTPPVDEPEAPEPAGIIISADAWTGRGYDAVQGLPAPAMEPVSVPAEETEPDETIAPESDGVAEPAPDSPRQAEAAAVPALPAPETDLPPGAATAEPSVVAILSEVQAAQAQPPSAAPVAEEPQRGVTAALPDLAAGISADAGALVRALDAGKHALGRFAPKAEAAPRNWETLIGGRWLNLIGIVLLVIGVVLLTRQGFYYLDERGKMAAGVAFALLLLLGGIVLEHRSTYRRIGSTLVGGGWALLYFDAYAAANIEAVKVISEPAVGFAVMIAVATGMVGHSLFYRTQFITSLAFGLGYLAVLLTPVSQQSLLASALLAAGLAVVSWAMSWQYLLAGGVIAAYSNHWFWLQRFAASQAGAPAFPLENPTQGFWISTAIVVFYWIIFAAVSLSRRMDKEMSRQLHLSVGVANAVGMLGLMTLQLTQGYGGHYLGFLTAPAALGYVVLARGEYRLGQRIPLLFAASLALLLAGITLPLLRQDLDIDLAWLAPVLLALGLAGIAAGLRVGELLLRAEGYLLAAGSFGWLVLYNLERPGAELLSPVWFAAPAMAAVYQLVSERLERQATGTMPDLVSAAWFFGPAAALSMAHVLWNQVPHDIVGLAWLALGFAALEAGARLPRAVLRAEGYLLAGLALAGFIIIDIAPGAALQVTTWPRPVVLLVAAAGAYAMTWRLMGAGWPLIEAEARLAWLPSAAGSVLVVAVAILDVPNAFVGASLAIWAVVLVEAGLRGAGLPVRVQSYAVMAFAVAAAATVNGAEIPIGVPAGPQSWAPLLVTAAALWWLYRRLVLQSPPVNAREGILGAAATVIANGLSAEILWKQLPADLVGLSWLAGGVVLFEVALRLGRVLLRWQAYAAMALAFLVLLAVDFDSPWPGAVTVSRWLSVGPAIAVYYAMTWRLDRGTWPRSEAERALSWTPSALATILVAMLAWVQLEHHWVTAALSAWAALLVETGRRVHRLPIRVEGYGLAVLGVLAATGINGSQLAGGSPSGPASWGPMLVTLPLLGWHFRRFSVPREQDHPLEAWVPEVASAAAAALAAQLLLKELPVDAVGLAWLAMGLVLFEVSAPLGRRVLRFEGYALQGLAVALLLVVNCGQSLPRTDAAARWIFVVPAIAGLYFSSARIMAGAAGVSVREVFAGWIPSTFATLLLALLAILDLDPGLPAGALSLWGLLLVEVGLRTRKVSIRLQGYAMAAGGALLAGAVNIFGMTVGVGAVAPAGAAAWTPVLVAAAVMAWLFVRLAARPATAAATFERPLGEAASWVASLLLALLAWNNAPSLAVALLWCALGFSLFQVAERLCTPILRAQAHLLLGAAYGRLYMANFVVLDHAGPISLRLLTVTPVLLALYCMMEQLRTPTKADLPGLFGRAVRFEARAGALAYSWAGFLGLVVLCRFELGREHAVAAWSLLILLFLTLGQRLDRQDFRFQTYLLAIYAVARAWATNLYLVGTWGLGIPERVSTTLPMIAVLFIAAIGIARPRATEAPAGASRIVRLLYWLDARGHTLFAVLASAFTALLLYYQLDANTLSIGLALEGFCLLALGLVINDRIFRLFGLGLLFICLVKLMVFDLSGVEMIYRIMSYIVLGLVLLLASFGYARYRDKIEKLI